MKKQYILYKDISTETFQEQLLQKKKYEETILNEDNK